MPAKLLRSFLFHVSPWFELLQTSDADLKSILVWADKGAWNAAGETFAMLNDCSERDAVQSSTRESCLLINLLILSFFLCVPICAFPHSNSSNQPKRKMLHTRNDFSSRACLHVCISCSTFQGWSNTKISALLKEYCLEQDWGRLSDLLSWMKAQVTSGRG